MDLFSQNVAYASVDSVIFSVNRVIINPLISLLFGLAVVYFLYGVYKFIAHSENEEARSVGKNHMIWGIIGIVVMMGVFTILDMIMGTLNIDYVNPKENTVNLPAYNPKLLQVK